ncbi:MAG: hypothetical protein M3409_08560, partial [Gemmatimonadota bacterium]|nr:hypothetical protein [Gemmatimonadota bacterium]
MKLFDVAWTDVLGVLPRWERLPREVRLRLLELFRPSGTASPDTFGAHLAEIREMGVLVPATSSGSRLGVAEEFRPLFRVLRAVYRHRLWDDSAPPALVRYLEEHFSVQDLQGVLDRTEWGWGWGNRQVVAQRVTAEEWVEGFLDEEAEKWEQKRLRPGDTALLAGERGAAAQRLVREILRHPQGVPLRELPEHFVELDLPLLGAALHAALHYLLLYAGTDAAGEARVGVWP